MIRDISYSSQLSSHVSQSLPGPYILDSFMKCGAASFLALGQHFALIFETVRDRVARQQVWGCGVIVSHRLECRAGSPEGREKDLDEVVGRSMCGNRTELRWIWFDNMLRGHRAYGIDDKGSEGCGPLRLRLNPRVSSGREV